MGAGHDGAARELARRLEANGYHTEIVDFIKLMPFGSGPILRRTYELQLRFCAWTYELSYQALSHATPLVSRSVVGLVNLLTRRSLRRRILADATRTRSCRRTRSRRSCSVASAASTARRTRRDLPDGLRGASAVGPPRRRRPPRREPAAPPRRRCRRGATTSFASGPLVDSRFRTARASRDRTRAGSASRRRPCRARRRRLAGTRRPGRGRRVDPPVAVSSTRSSSAAAMPGSGPHRFGRRRRHRDRLDRPDARARWPRPMPWSRTRAASPRWRRSRPVCPWSRYRPIAGHGRANARSMETGVVNALSARRARAPLRARPSRRLPGPGRDALVAAGRRAVRRRPRPCT